MKTKAGNYPNINEATFGDPKSLEFSKRDACINSHIIKAAIKLFLPYMRVGAEGFTVQTSWSVRIEDQHYSENEPHYILEIGEGSTADCVVAIVRTAYCDNHSHTKSRSIEQAPGEYVVTASVKDPDKVSALQLANAVSDAYAEALEKYFPDYYILQVRI